MAADVTNRRGISWRPVLAVLAVAGVTAGCASEADPADVAIGEVEFAATPEFVAESAERSTGEPYRVEVDLRMQISIAGDSLDLDAPFMSGEQDGHLSRFVMDFGPLFEEIGEQAPPGEGFPPGFTDGDLTMEMVADTSDMYLRAPMYEALSELGGAVPSEQAGPMAELAALGSNWGHVDLTELGEVLPLSDVARSAGGQAADPRVYLDLVAGTDEVSELGESEVRGDTVHGLAAESTFGEMLEAEGMDADEFAETMGTLPDGGSDIFEAMVDARMPIEVWIDDSGLVRRLDLEFDFSEIAESAGLTDDTEALEAFSYGITMDFFDYGDDGITIELPDEEDSVDITETFLELYAGSET